MGQARFIPGAVIAERYRVIGLLGRGGMGEVYRADDLKLGQAVALKFLPESFAADPGRLQRFYNEVKVARQVSHSNVCRVHDIDEYEGHPFISMEYIDGEDLSSLLRRIGRLPGEKAVQIARQICAGLAAAHERGILHRDLKPANVLLDGRGHAHLTDFGLAGLAQEIAGPEVRAGTPAYMAPEQLAGKEVTVRSDLYSLGLTLYELFTGKVAFEARSTEELIRLQTDTTPASPSRLVEGLDPSVERVILRCLERDPAVRPGSALAVAAALPGGDPLAAALAAGETPSPQMVADAGEEGALRPAIALAFAAIVLAGITLQAFTADGRHTIQRVPTPRSPEVLASGARDLIASFGYGEVPADSAWGFVLDDDLVREIREKDAGIDRWDRLGTARPAAYSFWYRQSPRVLVPRQLNSTLSDSDPPVLVSGMINVRLDPEGRLVTFTAVPPQLDAQAGESAEAPDWAPLFAAAGLEMASFREVAPQWNPLINCHKQTAWEGDLPDAAGIPLRVEACAYRSRPAWFTVVPAWRRPNLMEQDEPTGLEDLLAYGILGFVLLVLGTAAYLAWRSQRLGRSDRKGGFRLAAYLFSVLMLSDLLRMHHVPALGEAYLIIVALSTNLLLTALVWLLYLGVEPYVRRIWPDVLITWSRLLAGRLRDPRIGRDILIGGATHAALFIVGFATEAALRGLGFAEPAPPETLTFVLQGGVSALSTILLMFVNPLIGPLFFLVSLLVLRLLLRRQGLAIAALAIIGSIFVILGTAAQIPPGAGSRPLYLGIVGGTALVSFGCFFFVLIRYGYLAAAFAAFFEVPFVLFPISFDFSTFYSGTAFMALLPMAGVTLYAFHISRAGRPLLSGSFLPD